MTQSPDEQPKTTSAMTCIDLHESAAWGHHAQQQVRGKHVRCRVENEVEGGAQRREEVNLGRVTGSVLRNDHEPAAAQTQGSFLFVRRS